MRSIRWVFAVLAVCVLSSTAAGQEPCRGGQVTFNAYGACGGYSAPACACPGYGMVPGCCELPPSCCDNVWDGYCQERRRGLCGCRQAFGPPAQSCCTWCGAGY